MPTTGTSSSTSARVWVTVRTAAGTWVAPPTWAVWVPAGTVHAMLDERDPVESAACGPWNAGSPRRPPSACIAAFRGALGTTPGCYFSPPE
jgi:hypothetical protein